MALLTLGTAATTTLSAIKFAYALNAADASALQLMILGDSLSPQRIDPGAFIGGNGILRIPGRGNLEMQLGDFVAVDPATGWPILLSAKAAAGASWTHS